MVTSTMEIPGSELASVCDVIRDLINANVAVWVGVTYAVDVAVLSMC